MPGWEVCFWNNGLILNRGTTQAHSDLPECFSFSGETEAEEAHLVATVQVQSKKAYFRPAVVKLGRKRPELQRLEPQKLGMSERWLEGGFPIYVLVNNRHHFSQSDEQILLWSNSLIF